MDETSSLNSQLEIEHKPPIAASNINNVIMTEESEPNNQKTHQKPQQQHQQQQRQKLSISSLKNKDSSSLSTTQKNANNNHTKQPPFNQKYSSILKPSQLKQQRPDGQHFSVMHNKKFQFSLPHQELRKKSKTKVSIHSPLNNLAQEQIYNSDSISNKSNTDEDDVDFQMENLENFNQYERMTNYMNENQYGDEKLGENDDEDEEDEENNNFSDDDVHNNRNNDDFNDQDGVNSQSELFGFDDYNEDSLNNPLSHATHYYTASNYKHHHQNHNHHLQSRPNYQNRRKLIKKPFVVGSSSSSMSSQKNSAFKNYLFRTMSEILSSQLNLTRKVDQCRENYISINRRLKSKYLFVLSV